MVECPISAGPRVRFRCFLTLCLLLMWLATSVSAQSTPACPPSCDDANVCTDDSCDPLTGECTHVNNTASCNDGNACTIGDVCSGGTCQGTLRTCNDNNLCTDDFCDQATGCTFVPRICNDGKVCTDDSCDPFTGDCTYTNNTASCNDGNSCTLNDACSGGSCQGTPRICNDNNPCTDDSCNPAIGCTFTPNSNTCSDNSACTVNDRCLDGTCIGESVSCPEDENICTTSACHPTTGCVQVNNTSPCDDANLCTINDQCINGTCAGTSKVCSAANVCTTGVCDPVTGECTFTNNTSPCNDGNACTIGDVCSNGTCQGTALICNDNNSCTDDACNPATGCTFTPNPANTCSDDSACTANDRCQDGVCIGDSINCSEDENICTTSACDPTAGCGQVNNVSPCDDANPCTINDRCSNGTCAGALKVCSAANVCTTGVCDPVTGECTYVNNTASCNDGNPCTLNDRCSDGTCHGTPRVCDDGSFCTQDSCSPLTGCVHTPAPMTGCRTAEAMLVIMQGKSDAKDQLTFDWRYGSATPADFGDPTTSTGYELCVYDANGILVDAIVPPGGTCDSKPCWKAAGSNGYQFADASAAHDGIESVTLSGDVADPKAKVLIDGQGANLPDPVQPVAEPITVQLFNMTTGLCFEATFIGPEVLSNDASELRCKAP